MSMLRFGLVGVLLMGFFTNPLRASDELGRFPVLMYHQIGAKEAEWRRTPENFKQDLLSLYQNGYTPISLKDLVSCHIDIPKGKTPVLFTFDDGAVGQLEKIQGSSPHQWAPNSAVGMMLEFSKTHPDFPAKGVFFLNSDKRLVKQLQPLIQSGFEIGNHTYSHPKLSTLSQTGVEKQIVQLQNWVQSYVPNLGILGLALPFGIHAKNDEWVKSGEYEGIKFNHRAIFEVGAGPSSSPFSKRFNAFKIPRLRGSDAPAGESSLGFLSNLLKYFKNHPSERFQSDGNPRTIGVKKGTNLSDLRCPSLSTQII